MFALLVQKAIMSAQSFDKYCRPMFTNIFWATSDEETNWLKNLFRENHVSSVEPSKFSSVPLYLI